MNASARSSIAKVTSPPSPVAGVLAPCVAAELGQHLLAQGPRQLERRVAASSGGQLVWGRLARGAARASTSTSSASPSRMTSTVDLLAGSLLRRSAARGRSRSTSFSPSTATITSPPARTWLALEARSASSPPSTLQPGVVGRAAGDDLGDQRAGVGVDAELVGELRVERLAGDADVGVVGLAVLAQAAPPSARRGSIGTAKPTPSLPPERGVDLLVDADHLAVGVEQRAAGVAGVDRRVGLDRAVDLELGQRLDRAVGRRDDPDRERLLLAEGAADRGDRLADLDLVGVAELERLQVEARRDRP